MLKTLIVLIMALPFSFGKQAHTTDVVACNAPTNFHVSAQGSGSITLAWTNPYTSSDMKLYYHKHGESSNSQVYSTSAATFVFSNLAPGTYDVYIYTQCSGGPSNIIGITDIVAS